jgi:hypothetical protein
MLVLAATSAGWAAPAQFVPVVSTVSGPPYPTGATTVNIIVEDDSGSSLTYGTYSSSIKSLNPLGATDWFIADSFSFGVEREMKESGEKGGTEDINIGVGELQECTISKSMDVNSLHQTGILISPTQVTLLYEAVSPLGTVEFSSIFTTPQSATFAGVSVDESPDGQSFDLKLSLLYAAPYNPTLSILSEVQTGDFTAVPEPSGGLLLICATASGLFVGRFRTRQP